jgi:hypothetical protein
VSNGGKNNRQFPKWIVSAARFGFFAKGVVYCLLGILTSLAVIGLGGGKADTNFLFGTLLKKPISGKIALAVIALGMIAHAIFRLIQGFLDPEKRGKSYKALATRVGLSASGFAYLALSTNVIQLIFEISKYSGDNNFTTRSWVSKLLIKPWGQYLIGTIALVFFGRALWKIIKAFRLKVEKKIDDEKIEGRYTYFIDFTAKFGYISRGIIFGVIGYFFIRAAVKSNPGEVKDTIGAYNVLEAAMPGGWLLGLISAGLVGYGVFMIIKSFIGRFELDDDD